MRRNENGIPQFTIYDCDEPSDYNPKWTFTASMVGTCEPLFNECDSNYEVEEKLRKAKVIHPKTESDSESCQMFIYLSNRKSCEKFVERLNAYLAEKARRLGVARAVTNSARSY